MSSVSKTSGARKKVARDRRILGKAEREERREVPIAEGIRRAADRTGITVDLCDTERVTLLRGDLNLILNEIQVGFEEVLEAEFFETGAERDSLVLSVLRRLRNAETVIGVVTGGAQ